MVPRVQEATPGWIVGFDAFDAHEALCSLVASALSPLPRGSWRLVARPPHWPRLPTDFVAIEVTAAADVGSTSRAARRLLTQQAGRIAGSRTRVRGVWPRRWYTAERPSPSPAGGGGPRRRPLGSSASQTQPTSRDVTGRGKQTPYNFITKAYNASRWWSRDATGEWQSCARRFRDTCEKRSCADRPPRARSGAAASSRAHHMSAPRAKAGPSRAHEHARGNRTPAPAPAVSGTAQAYTCTCACTCSQAKGSRLLSSTPGSTRGRTTCATWSRRWTSRPSATPPTCVT